MRTSERQQEQQRELHTRLWAIANDLRGNMEANEFKNYILGLIFYRYLSEKVENKAKDLLSEDDISYTEAWADEEYREETAMLIEEFLNQRIEGMENEYGIKTTQTFPKLLYF